jgi:hypothetical protein
MHRRRDPQDEIIGAFAGLGLSPRIKTIITPNAKGIL